MLGLDNPLHIVFLLVLVLLVFGAKRLPEMGKSLGAGLRGFKESVSGDLPSASLSEFHEGGRDDGHGAGTDNNKAADRIPAQPVA